MKRYTVDEIYAKKKKKEMRRKMMRIIVYILVIPILIYNVTIVYQLFSSSNTTPSFFGYKTFVIVSGSMLPELQIGDIVVIKNVEQSDINEEDIISFREGNAIVTHRVKEIIEGENIQYRTKGDANNAEDANLVEIGDVEGEYSFKIPKLGKIIIFMQNKVGIIVIAILIYILYICNKNKEERLIMRREKREIYERMNKEKERKS